MRRTVALATVCLASWLIGAGTARAQNAVGYLGAPYTSPTVSPYLNLGYNSAGISNYQSLVRPLIEEREALSRQAINIQTLQRQIRDTHESNAAKAAQERDAKPRPGTVRRMYYSHYFGPLK